jgi:hypothetical protein
VATQATLFPSSGVATADPFLPVVADTALTDHGDEGRPPEPVAVHDPGLDLAKKTVCIKLRLSTMGNTRKVSTSQIEADADKDLLRVSKHLLDSAELKAIGRFDGEIRRFLYNLCLPFEIGIHLLPIGALETVEERLRKFVTDRQSLVAAFLAVYPSLCQDAARRLRGLYNPADYPPAEEVAREFGLSWQYVSFGVPDQLKGISQEVWEQERDKAARRMAEASSEIQQVLRQSMADLVAHMAERLKDGADGKPRKFKQSTVSNLVEFLSNFSFRNVTDDRQLQDLVGRARELLQGVAADDLRTNSGLRARVQQGMSALAVDLDGMLVKAGARRMRLSEDESS